MKCREAVEKHGFARDLCSYLRNSWCTVILNRYAFGGEFPQPDYIWQDHICCSHAKWYQVVSDLEGGIPFYCIDVGAGPYFEMNERKLRHIVDQMQDGIEWLEKVTGRAFDD